MLRAQFHIDHTTLQVDHAPREILTMQRRNSPS
jgi:hypothetical protein